MTILQKRFWAKVNKNGPVPSYKPELGPCWLWTGAMSGKYYGAIKDPTRDKMLMAHRLAYVWAKGLIPVELELDHLCRVTRCVNPDHLEAVTRQINVLRGQGFAAFNAKKTHCPKGHAYTQENTHVRKDDGGRECRACDRERRT